MKKILIITVIFLAFFLSSCEVLQTYNITVKNSCDTSIYVKLSQTSIAPLLLSEYNALNNGSTVAYPEQNYGKHYLHIRDTDYVVSSNRGYTCKEININRNETWTITWNGSAYVVTVVY